jgi:hypothetical protein
MTTRRPNAAIRGEIAQAVAALAVLIGLAIIALRPGS